MPARAARSHPSASPETRLAVGDVVADRFRILGFLGRGGMGEVYEAEHRVLRKSVALKLLRRRERGGASATERLLREARAASQLSSPHAIRVLDAGVAGETAFIAMELLEGADLAAMIAARGRLPREEAIAVVIEACDALGEAHAAGIVHRDVKPSNLFLATKPRGGALVKVLDFGVAKVLEESDGAATTTGSVIGSPRYMSPEQIRDPRKIDARTDVWSLGITLHELLTGRAPFESEFPSALCAMVTSEAPAVSIDDGDMPGLSALVLRCLEKSRDARFADASELGAALRDLAGDRARLPEASVDRDGDAVPTATPAPSEAEVSAVIARSPPDALPSHSRAAWVAGGLIAVGALAVVVAVAGPGPSGAPRPQPSASSVEQGPAPAGSASAPPVAEPARASTDPSAPAASANEGPIEVPPAVADSAAPRASSSSPPPRSPGSPSLPGRVPANKSKGLDEGEVLKLRD